MVTDPCGQSADLKQPTVIDDEDVEVLEDTPTTMVLRIIATGQVLVCKKHGVN